MTLVWSATSEYLEGKGGSNKRKRKEKKNKKHKTAQVSTNEESEAARKQTMEQQQCRRIELFIVHVATSAPR